jgi:CheY-like chemotaxis protein
MRKLESLSQLTGGLAHDFNNLLMVVMSSIELSLKRVAGDARLTDWLDLAMEAAANGAALTKRMLAFARRQELKPETCALSEVVRGMAEMMSHSLDPKVLISVDLPSELPAVLIDRNQLEVALLNLGLIARDAMPQGGELVIKAGTVEAAHLPEKLAPGAYVHLRVADTGVGMDTETLRRASEPFFSTKPTGKGSGLGLSMVHGLMLQSGGAIEVTSRPNEGTAVSLWLPVAPETLLRKPEAAGFALTENTSRRILLVDDDPLVLMVSADMLRELGHQPMEMSSAHEALEVLRAGERPGLAILDYAMPEMSGVALANAVRETCPDLPLLLATGYSEREKAGGNLPRLDKPYTIAESGRQIGLLMVNKTAIATTDGPTL